MPDSRIGSDMKYSICLFAFLTLSSSIVLAGGTFKDGPHFAYPTGGDVRDEQGGFGWQVTYDHKNHWSVDLSVTRQTDKLDDLNLVSEPFEDRLDLELVAIALSARLDYPIQHFTFYVGAGVGYYWMRTDNDRVNRSIRQNPQALPAGVSNLRVSADIDDTIAYHWAAGIEWRWTAQWEVFAEYRRVALESDIIYRTTEDRPRDDIVERQQSRTREKFSYDHGLIRAGVNYRF